MNNKIDRKPFETSISSAIHKMVADEPDNWYPIAYIGQGLVHHINGAEEPCLTDEEMLAFGKDPKKLEDYLVDDFERHIYGCGESANVKTDPVFMPIIINVMGAYERAYNEMPDRVV
jgi:hypothetical protein